MKLKLSDWLCVRWDMEQIADVIAQLLTCPREAYGGFLNPDVFVIEYPDDDEESRFGEVRIKRRADGFAEGLAPVKVLHTEADDVFVAGLMLYRLLTGMNPDTSAAQFLLVQAHDEQRVPLLQVPDSTLNNLVGGMTDLNPVTRITREDVLNRFAALWQGSAIIRIMEEETLTELERIRIPLQHGINYWQPAAHLRYGEQVFQPKSGKAWSIPYRLRPVEYVCPVTAQHFPMPDVSRLHFQQWETCYALDLGHTTIRTARMTPGKKPEGLPPMPAVIAFRDRALPVFGKAALELAETTPAELVWCIPAGHEPPVNRTVLAANGTSLQITPQMTASLMIRHIIEAAQELGFEENSPAVITMSAGHPAAVRNLWRQAAYEVGYQANILAAQTAILLYERLYEPVTGHVMVIDAGSGSTDVCVFDCGNGLTPQEIAGIEALWTHSYAAPGGSEMTDCIVSHMLQTVNLHHGLSLYQQKESGLGAEQFAVNRTRIQKAAEQIKRTLSFTEKADSRIELHNSAGTVVRVHFRYTRQQLFTLLEPVCRLLRQAMQQACMDSGINSELVQTVLVTGGCSLTPALRQTIQSFIQNPDCQVKYLDHKNAVIRGAVFCAALCEHDTGEDGITLTELPYDLGTLVADPVKGIPVFQTLIRAGTPMPNGNARCKKEYEVNFEDLNAQGKFQIRLYSRPRGMKHIQSTLDPEGNRIKILGIMQFDLPEEFKTGEDKLLLRIKIHEDETITATAEHLRSRTSLFGLLGGRQEYSTYGEPITGIYQPLS